MTRVGFIGLGTMGNPISTHLLDAGHELVAYDVVEEAMTTLVDRGAEPAESPADLAARVEVVFTSLPRPEHVETVALDREGLVDGMSEGSVLVDLSTSRPATTENVASGLAEVGADTIGAPVSRGAEAARDGTLAVMAGGDEAAFERCRPLIETFATDLVYVGDQPGHGHAVKLLNNYLGAAAMLATSEAMALGERVGLDMETMIEVFNASSGRNSATERKYPKHVVTGGYDTGYPLELMEKDLRLFAQFGDEFQAPLVLGEVVCQLLGYARAEYGGSADQTRLYDYYTRLIHDDE